MDIELAVPENWTIWQARKVEDAIREGVSRKVRGVKRARVRFVSKEEVQHGTISEEFVSSDVDSRASPEPDEEKRE